MSLDFSYLSDNGGIFPKYSLVDRDFPLFEEAFTNLQDKVGVFIDPCGKTRIFPDHQRLLMSVLNCSFHPTVRAFVAFLAEAASHDAVLLAEGD